jgi:DHA3 family macrolide efflux protein-like MFS transporter
MRHAILLSFFFAGIGYFAFSGAASFWLAAFLVMLAHMFTGILWVLSSTILQILTPDRLRGRIFAIDFGTNTLTNALSTFLVGLALEQWDARPVAVAMAVVFVVYAFLWGSAVLFSQHQHPQAWLAVTPGAASATADELPG